MSDFDYASLMAIARQERAESTSSGFVYVIFALDPGADPHLMDGGRHSPGLPGVLANMVRAAGGTFEMVDASGDKRLGVGPRGEDGGCNNFPPRIPDAKLRPRKLGLKIMKVDERQVVPMLLRLPTWAGVRVLRTEVYGPEERFPKPCR